MEPRLYWSVVTISLSCISSEILPLSQCTWLPMTLKSPSVWINGWSYRPRALFDSHVDIVYS